MACHESLTLRAAFDHEAGHRTDTAWTITEYKGPVGERFWHATLTASTPVPLIQTLLQHLDAPLPTDATEPHDPLRDAGWNPASHPARTTWRAPNQTIAFEHIPHATDDRWALYGGEDLDQAAWAVRLSAGVADELLAQLASAAAASSPLPRHPHRVRFRHPPSGSQRPGLPSAPTVGDCPPAGLRALPDMTHQL
ncbi:DUF317 domain-containing protein [Streptomyces sp. NPDC006314]|uniref:DUF317 domain-containing protein n=1 Tax=Streptomyces sp. NPDC006314 TaxID=3154475 RepID=UPI0033A428B0